jgi:hypothetical protein
VRRAALLVVLTVLAAGCGEHRLRGPVTTGGGPSASLIVTAGFGAATLHDLRVAPGQTVIAALEGATRITTSYGGLYVESIDGKTGSAASGHDWLFFVNGLESDVGAAAVTVATGDRIWWDYRAWRTYVGVPAVVGSWPEPFLHGIAGKRPAVTADPPLDGALRAAGADVVEGTAHLRALVGADVALRARDPLWRRAARDPQHHGLTAWIDGDRVLVWDAEAARARAVPTGVAVIAATRDGDDVVLAVAGTTVDGAATAAAALARDPSLVARRYAVVLDAGGAVVAAGGTG